MKVKLLVVAAVLVLALAALVPATASFAQGPITVQGGKIYPAGQCPAPGKSGSSTYFCEFYGTVTSMPATYHNIGTWMVSGVPVIVTSETHLAQGGGKITIGSPVRVKGRVQADGVTVVAKKIKFKDW